MGKLFSVIIMMVTLKAFAQTDSIKSNLSSNGVSNPLNFSGYVEGYYSYDFTRPENNNRPSFFYSHNRHNEFNINLAFLRTSYVVDRVRANLALAAGTYMNANYKQEPGVLKNVFEADAGYKLSVKRNLWLDIGILPSHIGWESAVSKDCWTLTRSIAADNTPYFEGGARLTYITNNSKWTFAGFALNGWQRITRVEGNSLMSWGTKVQFAPSDKLEINYSTFIGTDSPDSVRKWRYFQDVYGIFQFTPVIGLTLGFDYGQQQKEKGSSNLNHWFSPVGILRITPSSKWAFAFRGEYYEDEHGVIIYTGTGNGFKTSGLSLNIDYLPIKNIAMRLEGRVLHSKDAIFIEDGTAWQNNNTAVTFSVAVGL